MRSGGAENAPAATPPPRPTRPRSGGDTAGAASQLPNLSSLDASTRLAIYTLYTDALVQRSVQQLQAGQQQQQCHGGRQGQGRQQQQLQQAAAAVAALGAEELLTALAAGRLEWGVLLRDVGDAEGGAIGLAALKLLGLLLQTPAAAEKLPDTNCQQLLRVLMDGMKKEASKDRAKLSLWVVQTQRLPPCRLAGQGGALLGALAGCLQLDNAWRSPLVSRQALGAVHRLLQQLPEEAARAAGASWGPPVWGLMLADGGQAASKAAQVYPHIRRDAVNLTRQLGESLAVWRRRGRGAGAAAAGGASSSSAAAAAAVSAAAAATPDDDSKAAATDAADAELIGMQMVSRLNGGGMLAEMALTVSRVTSLPKGSTAAEALVEPTLAAVAAWGPVVRVLGPLFLRVAGLGQRLLDIIKPCFTCLSSAALPCAAFAAWGDLCVAFREMGELPLPPAPPPAPQQRQPGQQAAGGQQPRPGGTGSLGRLKLLVAPLEYAAKFDKRPEVREASLDCWQHLVRQISQPAPPPSYGNESYGSLAAAPLGHLRRAVAAAAAAVHDVAEPTAAAAAAAVPGATEATMTATATTMREGNDCNGVGGGGGGGMRLSTPGPLMRDCSESEVEPQVSAASALGGGGGDGGGGGGSLGDSGGRRPKQPPQPAPAPLPPLEHWGAVLPDAWAVAVAPVAKILMTQAATAPGSSAARPPPLAATQPATLDKVLRTLAGTVSPSSMRPVADLLGAVLPPPPSAATMPANREAAVGGGSAAAPAVSAPAAAAVRSAAAVWAALLRRMFRCAAELTAAEAVRTAGASTAVDSAAGSLAAEAVETAWQAWGRAAETVLPLLAAAPSSSFKSEPDAAVGGGGGGAGNTNSGGTGSEPWGLWVAFGAATSALVAKASAAGGANAAAAPNGAAAVPPALHLQQDEMEEQRQRLALRGLLCTHAGPHLTGLLSQLLQLPYGTPQGDAAAADGGGRGPSSSSMTAAAAPPSIWAEVASTWLAASRALDPLAAMALPPPPLQAAAMDGSGGSPDWWSCWREELRSAMLRAACAGGAVGCVSLGSDGGGGGGSGAAAGAAQRLAALCCPALRPTSPRRSGGGGGRARGRSPSPLPRRSRSPSPFPEARRPPGSRFCDDPWICDGGGDRPGSSGGLSEGAPGGCPYAWVMWETAAELLSGLGLEAAAATGKGGGAAGAAAPARLLVPDEGSQSANRRRRDSADAVAQILTAPLEALLLAAPPALAPCTVATVAAGPRDAVRLAAAWEGLFAALLQRSRRAQRGVAQATCGSVRPDAVQVAVHGVAVRLTELLGARRGAAAAAAATSAAPVPLSIDAPSWSVVGAAAIVLSRHMAATYDPAVAGGGATAASAAEDGLRSSRTQPNTTPLRGSARMAWGQVSSAPLPGTPAGGSAAAATAGGGTLTPRGVGRVGQGPAGHSASAAASLAAATASAPGGVLPSPSVAAAAAAATTAALGAELLAALAAAAAAALTAAPDVPDGAAGRFRSCAALAALAAALDATPDVLLAPAAACADGAAAVADADATLQALQPPLLAVVQDVLPRVLRSCDGAAAVADLDEQRSLRVVHVATAVTSTLGLLCQLRMRGCNVTALLDGLAPLLVACLRARPSSEDPAAAPGAAPGAVAVEEEAGVLSAATALALESLLAGRMPRLQGRVTAHLRGLQVGLQQRSIAAAAAAASGGGGGGCNGSGLQQLLLGAAGGTAAGAGGGAGGAGLAPLALPQAVQFAVDELGWDGAFLLPDSQIQISFAAPKGPHAQQQQQQQPDRKQGGATTTPRQAAVAGATVAKAVGGAAAGSRRSGGAAKRSFQDSQTEYVRIPQSPLPVGGGGDAGAAAAVAATRHGGSKRRRRCTGVTTYTALDGSQAGPVGLIGIGSESQNVSDSGDESGAAVAAGANGANGNGDGRPAANGGSGEGAARHPWEVVGAPSASRQQTAAPAVVHDRNGELRPRSPSPDPLLDVPPPPKRSLPQQPAPPRSPSPDPLLDVPPPPKRRRPSPPPSPVPDPLLDVLPPPPRRPGHSPLPPPSSPSPAAAPTPQQGPPPPPPQHQQPGGGGGGGGGDVRMAERGSGQVEEGDGAADKRAAAAAAATAVAVDGAGGGDGRVEEEEEEEKVRVEEQDVEMVPDSLDPNDPHHHPPPPPPPPPPAQQQHQQHPQHQQEQKHGCRDGRQGATAHAAAAARLSVSPMAPCAGGGGGGGGGRTGERRTGTGTADDEAPLVDGASQLDLADGNDVCAGGGSGCLTPAQRQRQHGAGANAAPRSLTPGGGGAAAAAPLPPSLQPQAPLQAPAAVAAVDGVDELVVDSTQQQQQQQNQEHQQQEGEIRRKRRRGQDKTPVGGETPKTLAGAAAANVTSSTATRGLAAAYGPGDPGTAAAAACAKRKAVASGGTPQAGVSASAGGGGEEAGRGRGHNDPRESTGSDAAPASAPAQLAPPQPQRPPQGPRQPLHGPAAASADPDAPADGAAAAPTAGGNTQGADPAAATAAAAGVQLAAVSGDGGVRTTASRGLADLLALKAGWSPEGMSAAELAAMGRILGEMQLRIFTALDRQHGGGEAGAAGTGAAFPAPPGSG